MFAYRVQSFRGCDDLVLFKPKSQCSCFAITELGGRMTVVRGQTMEFAKDIPNCDNRSHDSYKIIVPPQSNIKIITVKTYKTNFCDRTTLKLLANIMDQPLTTSWTAYFSILFRHSPNASISLDHPPATKGQEKQNSSLYLWPLYGSLWRFQPFPDSLLISQYVPLHLNTTIQPSDS